MVNSQKSTVNTRKQTYYLVLAGILMGVGLVLPFLTGQIPAIGGMLLPMHLPVLLCGLLCPWPYSLAVGFVLPLLRSVLFGMPPMMPTAVAMAFELAAYGVAGSLLMRALPRKFPSVYIALIGSMLAGRVVWGVVRWAMFLLLGSPFSWQLFVAGAFSNALVGVAVQLVILPPIVAAIWKLEERM